MMCKIYHANSKPQKNGVFTFISEKRKQCINKIHWRDIIIISVHASNNRARKTHEEEPERIEKRNHNSIVRSGVFNNLQSMIDKTDRISEGKVRYKQCYEVTQPN